MSREAHLVTCSPLCHLGIRMATRSEHYTSYHTRAIQHAKHKRHDGEKSFKFGEEF